MKVVIVAAAAALLCACAIGAERMTDRELDALVDQYVQCEHPDFVRVSIDELKADGRLTEPELAEAFYRGVLRFKDRKEDDSRLNRSLFWLANTLPEERLGKLRDLALKHTGTLGELAVWGLFKRTVQKMGCLEDMADVLRLNPAVRDAVWRQFFTYLEKQDQLKTTDTLRTEILALAEQYAEEAQDAWSCDYMLCHHLKEYAPSPRRKERLVRILSLPRIKVNPKLVEYFQRELDKMEPLGK